MIHLSQFIQVRNPMKNMKNCLNSTKTLENNNCKIFIFLFLVCKNSKTTKQKKYSKTENKKQRTTTKTEQHTDTATKKHT